MISVIVTVFGGCNPSPSGTEISRTPAVSTPGNSPIVTPSIVLPETPVPPSTSSEPTQSAPYVHVFFAGEGAFGGENITLEEAMRIIVAASYVYPDGYIRCKKENWPEDYEFLGAVNGIPVYDAKVIDDGYSQKGFDIFRQYYRYLYTEECIEKAMLLYYNGIVNINGVICDFWADMHGLMRPMLNSKGKMIVDEPDRKIVEVQVFEYVSFPPNSKYANYTLTRTENDGYYTWLISDIDLTPSFGTNTVIKKIFTEEEKKGYKELFLISTDYENTSETEREEAKAEMEQIIANAKNQEII